MAQHQDLDLFQQMTARIALQDRLSQMKSRATAQLSALDKARSLIAGDDDGIIWEVGYGGGRTYDRLTRLFPNNPIVVFDNRPDGRERVTNDGNTFLQGDIFEILPKMVARFDGKIRLMHADIGTPNFERDEQIYGNLGELVLPALTSKALIASDRPISADNWALIDSGLKHNWSYFLWQNRGA